MKSLTLTDLMFKASNLKYGITVLFKLSSQGKSDGKGKAATGLYKNGHN
jgi:hypothetical protein